MIDTLFWWTGALVWNFVLLAIGLLLGAIMVNAIEAAIMLRRVIRIGGWKVRSTWRQQLADWWEFFIDQPESYTNVKTGECVFWLGKQVEIEERERKEDERYDREMKGYD